MIPLLLACATPDAPVDSTPTPTCDLTFTASVGDGATGVPGNRSVRLTLSEPDATATVDGSVPGAVTRTSATTLVWTPSPPVAPLTDVTLAVSTCAGESTIGYRTSELGVAPAAGVDLAASGFRVDLASGTILRPTTGAALLGVLAAQGTELLVGLVPGADGAMGYRLAVATEGAQDPCSRTLDLAGGALDGGWFAFGPGGVDFYVYETRVVLQELAFGGAVRADGTALEAAWLRGWVGVEALAVAYADGDVQQACTFFGSLGAPCEPCPDGEGECLAIEVEDLVAEATGAPVFAVPEACPQDG